MSSPALESKSSSSLQLYTSVLVTANGCTKCISADTNSSTLSSTLEPGIGSINTWYLHGIAQCMLHTSSHAEVSCSVQLVLDEDGEFHLRNTSQEFLRTKKRQPKQLKLVREPVSVSIIKYHIVYSTELRVEDNEE